MTDQKKHEAAPLEPEKEPAAAADENKIDLREIKLTAAGDPLPINPDTGEIDVDKLTDAQRAELEATNKAIAEAIAKVSPGIKAAIDNANHVLEAIWKSSSGFNKLQETIKMFSKTLVTDEMRDLLREMRENLQPIQDLLDELDELKPFIKAELKKEEYGGKTFDDIMDYTPGELLEMLRDPDSLLTKIFEAARKAKAEAETVTIKHADDIEYPLDKINSRAWNLLTEDTGGQLKIAFDLLPKKQNLQATAYYSINFDNLGDNVKITKRLQPFDKRVYIAVSALYNAGNDVITATQIYYAMGNTGKPGTKHIKKIDDALSKMTGAKITLDNQHEHDALKGKYPLFKYDGSLLPIERITAIVNGQISESAIHIFREPPLMTFAKERKQVTTIDVALLQSPINKTDANLLIDDYLIDRISKAKNGKGKSCRILFKTLYEHAEIKTKMQRQRAPEKVEKYLTYYQQQGFIKRYTMQADGITVFF